MKLIWGYSRRMGYNSEREDYIMDLYKASMIRAKELGHQINFYGDKDSIKILKPYIDGYVVDITSKGFKYIEDLKVFVHSIENLDACYIDGDLILEERLTDLPGDVWFDFLENRNKLSGKDKTYTEGFYQMVSIFDSYDAVKKIVPGWRNNLEFTPNVGLFKFNNNIVKNNYLNTYYNLRSYYQTFIEEENDFGRFDPSLVIGQYMWGCLNEYHSYDCNFANESFNYTHFWGNLKYTEQAHDKVYSIVNKPPQLI